MSRLLANPSIKSALRTTVLCASTAAISFIATACSSAFQPSDPDRKYRTDLESLRMDLSPELRTSAETPVQSDMNWVVNKDQDMRSAWNDISRFWLTDRPRPLSPYPIMQTSGTP